MTKIITLILINLVTPKARAKHELLFNEPALEKQGWQANKAGGQTRQTGRSIDVPALTTHNFAAATNNPI